MSPRGTARVRGRLGIGAASVAAGTSEGPGAGENDPDPEQRDGEDRDAEDRHAGGTFLNVSDKDLDWELDQVQQKISSRVSLVVGWRGIVNLLDGLAVHTDRTFGRTIDLIDHSADGGVLTLGKWHVGEDPTDTKDFCKEAARSLKALHIETIRLIGCSTAKEQGPTFIRALVDGLANVGCAIDVIGTEAFVHDGDFDAHNFKSKKKLGKAVSPSPALSSPGSLGPDPGVASSTRGRLLRPHRGAGLTFGDPPDVPGDLPGLPGGPPRLPRDLRFPLGGLRPIGALPAVTPRGPFLDPEALSAIVTAGLAGLPPGAAEFRRFELSAFQPIDPAAEPPQRWSLWADMNDRSLTDEILESVREEVGWYVPGLLRLPTLEVRSPDPTRRHLHRFQFLFGGELVRVLAAPVPRPLWPQLPPAKPLLFRCNGPWFRERFGWTQPRVLPHS